MNVLCLATYSGDDVFLTNPLLASTMPQGHRYASNLIHSLQKIDGANVVSLGIAAYPSTFPHKGAPFHGKPLSKSPDIINVGFINVFGIKSISVFHALKAATKKIKPLLNEETIIISTESFTPYVLYADFLKRRFGCKTVLAVQDLPEFMSLRTGRPIYRALKKIDAKKFYKNAPKFDAFLPIAGDIATKINVNHRPYLIVDGMVRDEDVASSYRPTEPYHFFYAGSLHYRYDIKDLIDAFAIVREREPRATLTICGDGEFASVLRTYDKDDSGIDFLGQIRREEVIELERSSGTLVNPRRPHDYTRYSFPSKTLEYLASGRIVIAQHFVGINEAYYPFLRAPKDASAEGLADAMLQACSMSEGERKKLFEEETSFLSANNSLERYADKLSAFLSKI